MRVPDTAVGPRATPQEMPSDTMFAMAAAVMAEHGKFNFSAPTQRPSDFIKQNVEMHRDLEERTKEGPVDTPLTRKNDAVPGNRGLLGPWNRRT